MVMICTPFIILGGIYFKIFSFIIAVMSLYELLKYQKNIPLIIQIISYLFLGLLLFSKDLKISLEYSLLIIIFIYMLTIIFIKDNKKYCYKHAFLLIGIICFLGIVFSLIIDIRMRSLAELIYLVLIATGTDSFALLIGNRFGKKKLAPSISPNKTIEGSIGGSLVGTIIGTIYCLLRVNVFHKVYIIIILTFILSVVGQLGDLVKSSIKRTIGIKDFSDLIPGHGGVLDRLDSLMFISILYTIIINLF